MKVLHINSYYSVSSFYRNLYDKQIEKGLDLDVFVPVSSSSKSSDLLMDEYTKVSANHSKCDRFIFHLKHNKIYKDIRNNYNISDYSVIHAHSLFSNGYIALKLKKEYGTPYVVAVRNTDVNTFFKYMINLRKIGLNILKESEKIIFLSNAYKQQVLEKYIPLHMQNEIESKVEVIPNGIDDFWLKNKVGFKLLQSNERLKLLYIGVINKNKNILKTIEAIEILRNSGRDISLTIVGKVQDKSIFNKIGNYPFVKYLKPMKKEELLLIYRDHHIFVMPSTSESFGLVYAEAMSQGLPVIYSEGQGFDRQFEEGLVGYHVNSGDSIDISEKIVLIQENYSEISSNCVKSVDKFRWESISNKYSNIYVNIANRSHPKNLKV